ncbi:hypothetical protein [Pseudomonas syringae group genomosp. 7]|uniref:hypothetical protein n=1 Tax=Pseudomonas syringae group genomosp. 7 TaxID=251699 RepID=UPI0006D5F919|nr:hypothetical protein [Pseudomonas syringae group genomosp. 7]UNB63761.1 hypothetical protein MME54_02805 [Pseudomonas syringae pv. helianthi]
MDISVYSASEISNEEISSMISAKRSFKIKDIESDFFGDTVETVEKLIESQGLTCRIYTAGRITALGVTALTVIGGVAAGLAIAAHNIATYNPDYKIAKLYTTKTLIITYNK